MRMPARSVLRIRPVLWGALLLFAFPCHAQTEPDGSLLGRTESELQANFPDLQRLHKPLPGPRGLRGLWVLPTRPVAGLPLETTFYLKNGRVHRIEQRLTSTERQCSDPASFAVLVSAMESRYGPGLVSSDTAERETKRNAAVWAAGAFDVAAHFARSPGQCAITVVYHAHAEKDAAEL